MSQSLAGRHKRQLKRALCVRCHFQRVLCFAAGPHFMFGFLICLFGCSGLIVLEMTYHGLMDTLNPAQSVTGSRRDLSDSAKATRLSVGPGPSRVVVRLVVYQNIDS